MFFTGSSILIAMFFNQSRKGGGLFASQIPVQEVWQKMGGTQREAH